MADGDNFLDKRGSTATLFSASAEPAAEAANPAMEEWRKLTPDERREAHRKWLDLLLNDYGK